MVWLVFGLPAASVVAGLGLVAAAMEHGASDSVRDEVTRTGQIQLTRLGPDARAASMRASALLTIAGKGVDVLPVSGVLARSLPLRLSLSHPTNASLDRQLTLQPSATGWHSAENISAGHDWILQVAAVDGHWRLQGRLAAGGTSAYLAPALPAD